LTNALDVVNKGSLWYAKLAFETQYIVWNLTR
jgi:hypothetical protein